MLILVVCYDDDMMFEVNAANEFAVWVAKEIQAEIIANGRPSPAKLRNAMSNPYSFKALQQCGLIPEGAVLLEGNADPLNIQIKPVGTITHIIQQAVKPITFLQRIKQKLINI